MRGRRDSNAPAGQQPGRGNDRSNEAGKGKSTTTGAVAIAFEQTLVEILRRRGGHCHLTDRALRQAGLMGRRLDRVLDDLTARGAVSIEANPLGPIVRLAESLR